MEKVRPAAVSGSFYPAQPDELCREVEQMLADGPAPDVDVSPRMVIVPHAGYRYSGPVAAHGYRLLVHEVALGRRIVLLGPAHFVRFAGLATPDAGAFATPLGGVDIDGRLTDQAETHPAVSPRAEPHASEHSLEVQLPFLQVALDDISIAPLLTGEVSAADAATVLGDLIAEPGVTAVISSDLSHYLDYETARRRDAATALSITDLRPEQLAWGDACGLTAVQAALLVARQRDWACRLLDLRNSGDTAGTRDRVVGYGTFVVGPRR